MAGGRREKAVTSAEIQITVIRGDSVFFGIHRARYIVVYRDADGIAYFSEKFYSGQELRLAFAVRGIDLTDGTFVHGYPEDGVCKSAALVLKNK